MSITLSPTWCLQMSRFLWPAVQNLKIFSLLSQKTGTIVMILISNLSVLWRCVYILDLHLYWFYIRTFSYFVLQLLHNILVWINKVWSFLFLQQRRRVRTPHPPEESAQCDVTVSGGPQLLQQQVETLHADLLLQELRGQLTKQVSGPLPAAHTHTHTQTHSRSLILILPLLPSCAVTTEFCYLMTGSRFPGEESDKVLHLRL